MRKIIIFGIWIMFMIIAAGGAHAQMTSDLRIYYSMDDANVTASTIFTANNDLFNLSNNGTVENTSVSKSGSSLWFNGTGAYAYYNVTTGYFPSVGTLNFWVKRDMTDHDGQMTYLSCRQTGAQDWFVIRQYNDTLYTYIDGTAIKPSVAADENWHMITIVFGNIPFEIWLDGGQIASNGSLASPSSCTKKPFWGVLSSADLPRWSVPEWTQGSIDEIGIWSRHLTSDEIGQLYAGSYYPFLGVLNLSFYDSNTLAIIDDEEITLETIGDTYTNSTTTTDGWIRLIINETGTMQFRYHSNDTYGWHTYHTYINWDANDNISLYLINNSAGSNITATVYDEIGDYVEKAYIKTLKHDIDTNTFNVVSTHATDFIGQASIYLVKYDQLYRFIIEYPIGTVRYTSNPTYIKADNINFQIVLGQQVASQFYTAGGISYSLTYDNSSHNVTLTYSTTASDVTKGCLKIQLIGSKGVISTVNDTCASGAAGSIEINIANVTGYIYEADAYVQFDDGRDYQLDSMEIEFSEDYVFGPMGGLAAALMVIVFMFIGIAHPAGFALAVAVALVFTKAVGILPVGWSIVVTICGLGLIIAFIVGRRST